MEGVEQGERQGLEILAVSGNARLDAPPSGHPHQVEHHYGREGIREDSLGGPSSRKIVVLWWVSLRSQGTHRKLTKMLVGLIGLCAPAGGTFDAVPW